MITLTDVSQTFVGRTGAVDALRGVDLRIEPEELSVEPQRIHIDLRTTMVVVTHSIAEAVLLADHHRWPGPKKTPELAARFAAEYNVPFTTIGTTRRQFDAVPDATDVLPH
jgi:hypothetical protein